MSKNILITGITGLLGRALAYQAPADNTITGIYIGDYSIKDSGANRYYITNVCNINRLREIFKHYHFDVVIHTAGIASVDYCQNNYQEAFESNVLGTKNVVECCKGGKAKLIYVSTNAVFDGSNPPYKEADTTNPINNYGKIKRECEKLVSKELEDYLIVRPILMYGWNNEFERKNFVTWLLEQGKKNALVKLVNDVYENPLLSYQCAEAIWRLIKEDKRGVYHIAGRDILNRYEVGLKVFDVFGLDKKLISAVDSSYFSNLAPRPKGSFYLTEKLERELDFKPLGFEQGLKYMKNIG